MLCMMAAQAECHHLVLLQVPKERLLALALGRGPTGAALDLRHVHRGKSAMLDEMGRVLINACQAVPQVCLACCCILKVEHPQEVSGIRNSHPCCIQQGGLVGPTPACLGAVRKRPLLAQFSGECNFCISYFQMCRGWLCSSRPFPMLTRCTSTGRRQGLSEA